MGGAAKIPVSAAVREAARVRAGDRLHVRLEVDDAPRTVALPDDLAATLADDPDARAFSTGCPTAVSTLRELDRADQAIRDPRGACPQDRRAAGQTTTTTVIHQHNKQRSQPCDTSLC